MNKSILRGRLVKDPELKYMQSGKAFVKINLAVTRDYDKEKADFINCQAWDKTAEIISEHCRKGSELLIDGRIQTGNYEKEDGTKVYTTDIVINRFEFIGGKKEEVKKESDEEYDKRMDNTSTPNLSDDIDDDSFPF